MAPHDVNKCLRDAVAWRVCLEPHYRTGTGGSLCKPFQLYVFADVVAKDCDSFCWSCSILVAYVCGAAHAAAGSVAQATGVCSSSL